MRSLAFAVLFGSALLLPDPAQAQFGKLGAKLGKKVGIASSSNEGAIRTGDMKFEGSVVEITDDVLDRFLSGLAAEKEAAVRVDTEDVEPIIRRNEAAEAKYDKQREEYDRKSEAWDRCSEPIMEAADRDSEAAAEAAGDLIDEEALERLAARMEAAQKRNDTAEVMRLSDSARKLMQGAQTAGGQAVGISTAASARVQKECGTQPTAPKRPTREHVPGASDVRAAGLAASGMDDGEYLMLRERITPFVASGGKSSGMVYTKDEAEALKARIDDLMEYKEVLTQW